MRFSILFICLGFVLFPLQAQAYIGPGLGLGVVGTIVGVLFSIVLGLLGIFWYPLKRLFAKSQKRA